MITYVLYFVLIKYHINIFVIAIVEKFNQQTWNSRKFSMFLDILGADYICTLISYWGGQHCRLYELYSGILFNKVFFLFFLSAIKYKKVT